MSPSKRFFDLLKFFKKNFMFFLFVGSFVGIAEYLLITNIYELFFILQSKFESKALAAILLIFSYIFIIFLGLFLIFISQRTAFISSLKYVHNIILKERPQSYIRNPEELTRALNIERERLAKEIISPMQSICIKIALPIAAAYVVINSDQIDPILILPPLFLLVVAFTVSSYMFAKYARHLEKALSKLGEYTYTFVKNFDTSLRFMSIEKEEKRSNKDIKHLATTEGFIDAFSQLPRHAIDFCLFSIIVFGFIFSDSDTNDLFNIVILSPLFLRAISSVQAIYKGFASIRSNISALNILGESSHRLFDNEKLKNIKNREIIYSYDDGSLSYSENGNKSSSCKIHGICLPSGVGKTNAILNSLHPGIDLPTSITINYENLKLNEISYISGEPFFNKNEIASIELDNLEFKSLFDEYLYPSSSDPLKCSMGELFRWNLYKEMSRSPKLIIIDESIVHVGEDQQNKIIHYFESEKNKTALIIVSHSVELIDRCQIKLT